MSEDRGPSRRDVLRGIAAGTGASAIAIGAPAAANAASPAAPGRAIEVLLPDTVYLNGNVITMDGDERVVQAVAVKGDKIVAVGSDRDLRHLVGNDTKVVNLRGKTVVPGFIDAHSHFPSPGSVELYYANVSSPPVGPVENLDDLAAALRAKADETPAGEWIRARGYDQAQLAEQRHPTKEDLDRGSADHPIWARHVSGHMAAANSLALELAGIDRDGPDDDRIIRDPQTGEPTGLLLGGASSRVSNRIPSFTNEQRIASVKKSVEMYVAAGVTTSVIPSGGATLMRRLNDWRAAGLLPIRFTCNYFDSLPMNAMRAGVPTGFGSDWITVGAYGEQVYDGSIQGWTGYLKQPYHTIPEYFPDGWRGEPYYPNTLPDRVRELHQERYQTAIHANGDAAIEELLDAIEAAQDEHGDWGARHRIEHAQMATPAQLRRMQRLGVSPSFFVSHTFYWGDEHRDIFLGPFRAARISPLKSATELGIRYSIHLDSPVVPMSPLQGVWSAVNRLTRTGKVLGPDERVDPMTALRAVTIDAAWQNHQEESKGSLEAGKLADLVVLRQDPLTVDPTTIRDIEVLETVVGGDTVYRAGS